MRCPRCVRWVGIRTSATALALGISSCRHRATIAARIDPMVNQGVAGIVFDSLAGAPLASARVELVDAAHPEWSPIMLVSDSTGGFARRDIAAARYVATFFHPRLDSLGLQTSTFLVDLRGPRGVWLGLGIPSAARLRAMFCGERSDSTGLLIGRVLDARTQSGLSGAVVTAEWLEVDPRFGNGVQFRRPYTQTLTRTDGSFALCDVPLNADFGVHAGHPGKRSGTVGVKLLAGGVASRDLLVADSQHVVVRGSVIGGNGAPVPRARISAIDMNAEATADENGIFALPIERGGTQTFVVRAIGYYPEERTVDVWPDSLSWIQLELPTRVSQLDTMHVRARRQPDDRDGFSARRAGGVGTFVTADDIETSIPRSVTDLIQRSPSTPLARLPNGHLGVRARGMPCLPIVVLDGHSLPVLQDLTEIDAMVDLSRIVSMEVYTAGEAPRQYMTGSPCAVIVIATKRS